MVPQLKLQEIDVGMMQFMLLRIIGMFLIMLFPVLAAWLPDVFKALFWIEFN